MVYNLVITTDSRSHLEYTLEHENENTHVENIHVCTLRTHTLEHENTHVGT